MDKRAELGEAKVRAKLLRQKMGAQDAARLMAAEFHLCVYCVGETIFASFYETDRSEIVERLSF
jgi:hypothetical protein